jgi:hypothetical protein
MLVFSRFHGTPQFVARLPQGRFHRFAGLLFGLGICFRHSHELKTAKVPFFSDKLSSPDETISAIKRYTIVFL